MDWNYPGSSRNRGGFGGYGGFGQQQSFEEEEEVRKAEERAYLERSSRFGPFTTPTEADDPTVAAATAAATAAMRASAENMPVGDWSLHYPLAREAVPTRSEKAYDVKGRDGNSYPIWLNEETNEMRARFTSAAAWAPGDTACYDRTKGPIWLNRADPDNPTWRWRTDGCLGDFPADFFTRTKSEEYVPLRNNPGLNTYSTVFEQSGTAELDSVKAFCKDIEAAEARLARAKEAAEKMRTWAQATVDTLQTLLAKETDAQMRNTRWPYLYQAMSTLQSLQPDAIAEAARSGQSAPKMPLRSTPFDGSSAPPPTGDYGPAQAGFAYGHYPPPTTPSDRPYSSDSSAGLYGSSCPSGYAGNHGGYPGGYGEFNAPWTSVC